METDSAQLEIERQNDYRQLIYGSPGSYLISEPIKLQNFDSGYEFNKRYTANLVILPLGQAPMIGLSSASGTPFFSPFFHSGTVLSEAAYKMGDKFVLGGYSYGVNSMFSAPFPNQGGKQFDSYGSTLFMQYNVSKKVKIETRINVIQGNYPNF
ncbi:MAG: hypothetical protein R2757_01115 [Draconibacterium sp.]